MAKKCRDCGVAPGELHHAPCGSEQCPLCGYYLSDCVCANVKDFPRLPWSGEGLALAECREYGFMLNGNPNRIQLLEKCVWDRERLRFVLRENS